jgi:hypothetical protein
MKTRYRELAFTELLYIYGGFIVPNSFVCSRNLSPLYEEGIKDSMPFVLESINHYCDTLRYKTAPLFTPTTQMMGCVKRDPAIRALADYLKIRNQNPHFNSEGEFSGYTSSWISGQIKTNKMKLISGDIIGVKSLDGKTILLDDLMEENYLNLCPNRNYGILIPGEEVLNRTKYQWFAVISVNELLKSNAIVSKYLSAALADGQLLEDKDDDGVTSTQGRTVISI